MSKYALIFLLLAIVACSPAASDEYVDEDDAAESAAENLLKDIKQGDFEIIVIDGCQYLIYTEDFGSTQQGYGFMAHKGNCNNPAHKCPPVVIQATDSIQ